MNAVPARRAGEGPREACGRRPVAVLLSRFPTVTETFILREVNEMERQGQPVRLVPLLRQEPPVVHDDARAWSGRALYTRFISRRILGANVRTILAAPRRYLSVVRRVLTETAGSLPFLIRSLALLPKAFYLARRLEAEGIRHVHAHFATHPATVAWVISELTDITFSVTAHAHDIFVDHTFLREKLQAAAFVRVISEFNRSYLLSRFPELDGAGVHVVHVGVDVERYGVDAPGSLAEVQAPRHVGSGDGSGGAAEPLVVTVAALRRYKGIAVLVEACYRLLGAGIPIRCVVAGDGPLRDELRSLVAAYGLEDRIRLLGAIPEEAVRRLLARASVFVLPSLVQPDGQMDGIPVALMEAMASGLPVVASDLSGIPELVEDGTNGLLVPPGDAEEVAASIRTLLERPGVARAMGRRGRDTVREAFALEGTVSRLLELLDEHAGSVPPGSDGSGPETARTASRRRSVDPRARTAGHPASPGREAP